VYNPTCDASLEFDMLRNTAPDLACSAGLQAFFPGGIRVSEREDGLCDLVLAGPASLIELIRRFSTGGIAKSKATRPQPSVTAIPLDARSVGSARLAEPSCAQCWLGQVSQSGE